MAACKLRLVAATTRTFVWMDRVPPTRSNSCSCKTRNRAIWVSAGSSPTSSRKIVPPSASSNRPSRRCNAPVKEPFSWPNNSEAIKSRGIAAQLTLTKAREERRDRRWIARARSSLPVPVSPVTRTVASVGATLDTRESAFCRAPELPTISSHIGRLSISSGRATPSCLSLSSVCFGSAMITATLAMTCPLFRTLHPCQTSLFQCAYFGGTPVCRQPQMESPCAPYRTGRNTLLKYVRTNTKEVGDLTHSISRVDALPSKKAGINGPGARSEHRQGGTEGSQQDIAPRIMGMREGAPDLDDRQKYPRDGCP